LFGQKLQSYKPEVGCFIYNFIAATSSCFVNLQKSKRHQTQMLCGGKGNQFCGAKELSHVAMMNDIFSV
jgi:hypothetical protein